MSASAKQTHEQFKKMSFKPKFENLYLANRCYHDIPGSPRVRMYVENVPGVDGDFIQNYGKGGREIIVRGEMSATGATGDLAHANCKKSVRDCQKYVGQPGKYVGCDEMEYLNCVLTSYKSSRVQVVKTESGYTASATIEARLYQAGV